MGQLGLNLYFSVFVSLLNEVPLNVQSRESGTDMIAAIMFRVVFSVVRPGTILNIDIYKPLKFRASKMGFKARFPPVVEKCLIKLLNGSKGCCKKSPS